jgi:ABC-type sugar transport system ATPase subunit
MIAGLEQPTGGELWLGDKCAFSRTRGISLAPVKRGLGLVFQSYALWPHLTVEQNIAFGLQVQRESRSETKRRVREMAEAMQIDQLLGRYTSELSGGQQQRVAIARVLVMRPDILLLDEPLSNLDSKLRMDMRAELKRLHEETGATVIYVTHDQLEALTMSTHIALMNNGELQQFAPPLELYAHPANRFSADFLGNPRINFLDGVVEESGAALVARCGGLLVPLAGLRLRAGERVTVGLRAEELRLLPPDSANGAATPATVVAALPTGTDWYYRVRFGEHEVMVRDNDHPGLRSGDQVRLAAYPNPIKVFGADGRLLGGAEQVALDGTVDSAAASGSFPLREPIASEVNP